MGEYFVDYRQFFADDEVFEDTMSLQAEDSLHALQLCENALVMGNAEFELVDVYLN